jgi:hypothetical protein
VHYSPIIITVTLRREGHVEHTREMRKACETLDRKPKGKEHHGRLKFGLVTDIEKNKYNF